MAVGAGELNKFCCICRQFLFNLRNRSAKLARFAIFASPTLFKFVNVKVRYCRVLADFIKFARFANIFPIKEKRGRRSWRDLLLLPLQLLNFTR